MPFNSNGVLPPGFHDWELEEIEENLVVNFSKSKTRSRIFSGYTKLLKKLKSFKLEAEQWLDGSFSTTKVNPGDLDMLTIIEANQLNKIDPSKGAELKTLFDGPNTKKDYLCDSYILAKRDKSDPNYEYYRKMHKYWYGEFSLDRSFSPKGIVRVKS